MKKHFQRKEARIPFTPEGYQNVLDEKSKLLSMRPEAVENLRKGREMGDLSENGYYKEAKARLSFIDAQLRRVERLVRLGVIVTPTNTDRVEIGNTVVITDGTNEFTYTVVGGYESNPVNKTISPASPIGKALMGKRANETVEVNTPGGPKQFTILKIS